MNIDFGKIREIYGEDALVACNENLDYLVKNINYLIKLGFDDYEDIIERFPLAFVDDHEVVKEKVDKLIGRLGDDYINILGEDMGLWEELL